MEKFNIKENRPELTKAEIEQGMDFSKISAGAKGTAKIISLKGLLVTGIAATVIISGIVLWPKITGDDSGKDLAENIILPNKENSTDTFLVSSEKDTTLIYSTGTKIKIPAGSFVNEKGEPVKGNVKINYREFHKVSEILLAGIPMRYDSAGKEMYFESAGMFDISANQAEKPVFIANGRSLEVNMATLDRTENKYNQYLLDEKTGQWSFIKRDAVEAISRTDSVASVNTNRDAVKKTAPVKPVSERMFTIDAEGRPDLTIYKNIVFEVTKDCKTFDPEAAKIDWGMVNIEKTEKKNRYKVTFSYPLSGPLRTYEVIAQPCQDGNMEEAMRKYDELYAAYKKRLGEAEQKDIKEQEELNRERGDYTRVFERYEELQAKNAALYAEQWAKTADVSQVVYRTFQVKQFGIWNSDCPQSMPQGMEVLANFESASGDKIKISAVYLVEKGKNALYNLYVPQKISFNPNNENVLLVITRDGKLGYVKNDVFDGITNSTKSFTFKLTMLNKDKYTLGDIDGIVI